MFQSVIKKGSLNNKKTATDTKPFKFRQTCRQVPGHQLINGAYNASRAA